MRIIVIECKLQVFHYSKCIFISFMLVSLMATSQGNIFTKGVDIAVYKAIQALLLVKHPENPELAKCIVDDFTGNKVADKITYSPDLVSNPEKLQNEIKEYEDSAEIKCKVALFLQTPIGICILILILLLLISLSCCIIRCICC